MDKEVAATISAGESNTHQGRVGIVASSDTGRQGVDPIEHITVHLARHCLLEDTPNLFLHSNFFETVLLL